MTLLPATVPGGRHSTGAPMQPIIYMAGGFEDIIPVVVILGVLISKIVKASRKAKQGDGDIEPDEPPKRPAAPDELRKFLETITGTATEPAAPVRPPAPRAVPVVKAIPAPPPAPVISAPPEARRTPGKRHAHGAPVQRQYDWNQRPTKRKTLLVEPLAIGKDLVDRKTLAKAVVLREILGPPLGLQE